MDRWFARFPLASAARFALFPIFALHLVACAAGDKSAPPASYPSGSTETSVVAGSNGDVKAEMYALSRSEPASPSMAPSYAPPREQPMRAHEDRAKAAPGSADAPSTGGAPPPPPPPPSPASTPMPPQPAPAKNAPDRTTEQAQAPAGHDATMLVYTANLNLAVYLVDQAVSQVEQIAKDNGGFLSSRADSQITIRVPRARFQAALAAIEKTGDVLHRDVRAEDVTDQYTDLAIRIKNARAMRDQLAVLLQKAAVKEAIEIERELGRVTEELERMEGQLSLLKDKIAYSTITASYTAHGGSIQATKVRLPFPWLSSLGLPNLLRLEDNK